MNTKDIISKAIRYLTNPDYRFVINSIHFGMYCDMPDEDYLKRMFRQIMGYELNLDNPRTFNEKIQWLKLYDRNPLYSTMVDKFEVKKYVADIIGEEYIIPALGIWNAFDEIDFSRLPNQFVLKCTHDSGGLVICRDKQTFNVEKARKKINKSLQRNYYYWGREWSYKNVQPRILAERYMEDSKTHEVRDYKFFTFNGIAKVLLIATERQLQGKETKYDYFDMEFRHLPFTTLHPNAAISPAKPEKFELMKRLAEKLSVGIPHVRVDFYEINGRVYFGELTFYTLAGFIPFEPKEWDETFGKWLTLPGNRQ